MRKITFFLMFTLFAFVLKANDGVMLTLKAEPGKSLDFDVYVTNELQNISVDWGDGNKQVYENVASIQANSDLPTKISGWTTGRMAAERSSSLAASNPATSSHFTFGFSSTITLRSCRRNSELGSLSGSSSWGLGSSPVVYMKPNGY